MKNPRAWPEPSPVVKVVIAVAAVACIGAAAIPVAVNRREANPTCQELSARDGLDHCVIRQVGSVPNTTP